MFEGFKPIVLLMLLMLLDPGNPERVVSDSFLLSDMTDVPGSFYIVLFFFKLSQAWTQPFLGQLTTKPWSLLVGNGV